jgi:hypothetical protein
MHAAQMQVAWVEQGKKKPSAMAATRKDGHKITIASRRMPASIQG